MSVKKVESLLLMAQLFIDKGDLSNARKIMRKIMDIDKANIKILLREPLKRNNSVLLNAYHCVYRQGD